MLRAGAVTLVAIVALGGPVGVAATTRTHLAITVYPKGLDGAGAHSYSLRCGPAVGTVPHPGKACELLARLKRPFAPVPSGTMCAQIALGPQEAVVRGTLVGQRVTATLSLRNSCEIDRWHRVAAVVPGFGASG